MTEQDVKKLLQIGECINVEFKEKVQWFTDVTEKYMTETKMETLT